MICVFIADIDVHVRLEQFRKQYKRNKSAIEETNQWMLIRKHTRYL